MKTENEQLKEIFRKNLGQVADAPGFELMWQRAAKANRKKWILVWRVAAGIALIVSAGTMAIVYRQHSQEYSRIQITSWRAPSEMLIPSQTGAQLTALTLWT